MTNGIDTIIIKMPRPQRWGIFAINRRVKVGFSFTNLAFHFFRENIGVGSENRLKDWIKTNGEPKLLAETIWSAYQAYMALQYKKEQFTKSQFSEGFLMLDEETKGEVVQALYNSQSFGFKKPPGIKKKTAKKI